MAAALARALDARTLAVVAALIGRSRRVDRAAALAAEHLAKLYVLVLALLMLGGRGPAGRRRRQTALRIGVALPLTIGAVAAVGRLVGRERPFASQAGVALLVAHAPERSFPSRHTACAAAMATVALPTVPGAGLLMGLAGVALALSRVYAGLHYPTDVLGGWAIGVAVGLLVRSMDRSIVRGMGRCDAC